MRNILYTLVLLAIFLIGSKFIITSKYKAYIEENYNDSAISTDTINNQDYILISETESPVIFQSTSNSFTKHN